MSIPEHNTIYKATYATSIKNKENILWEYFSYYYLFINYSKLFYIFLSLINDSKYFLNLKRLKKTIYFK